MSFEKKVLNMTRNQMQTVGNPILGVMNTLQTEHGFTIDEVLMGTLFAVGAAIRQRGGVLDMTASLRIALPPLVAGYEAADVRVKQ